VLLIILSSFLYASKNTTENMIKNLGYSFVGTEAINATLICFTDDFRNKREAKTLAFTFAIAIGKEVYDHFNTNSFDLLDIVIRMIGSTISVTVFRYIHPKIFVKCKWKHLEKFPTFGVLVGYNF